MIVLDDSIVDMYCSKTYSVTDEILKESNLSSLTNSNRRLVFDSQTVQEQNRVVLLELKREQDPSDLDVTMSHVGLTVLFGHLVLYTLLALHHSPQLLHMYSNLDNYTYKHSSQLFLSCIQF